MNISNRMTVLAAELQIAENRRARGRAEQIEGDLEIGRVLLEARGLYADHAEFGKWLAEAGSTTSHQDRAAYIAMAADPERFRAVLEKTERRSIQLIYEKEFKTPFTSASKSHARPKPTPELEKALHAYDRRNLAGEPLTYEAVQKEAGLTSSTAVRRAIAMRRAEEQIGRDDDIVLSMSAQERFDAKVRAFKKSFDYEVETAARKLQNQWAEESLQRYSERLTKFERQLVFRPGVMKASEYKTLMMCCHPDTAANVGDGKRNEAVRILTEYRLKLMNEKEDLFVSRHGLPRTREELQRAREEVRAANSARSKAAHAARKQREKT